MRADPSQADPNQVYQSKFLKESPCHVTSLHKKNYMSSENARLSGRFNADANKFLGSHVKS